MDGSEIKDVLEKITKELENLNYNMKALIHEIRNKR